MDELPPHAAGAQLERLASRLLGLYRGPFCGAASTASILRCRELATRRFVKAVEGLAARFARLGELDARSDLLEEAVSREEQSEALHQALVNAWIARGRKAEAMRALDRCRAVLRTTWVSLGESE